MNLNKYTKAELISKFKKLESKNSNQPIGSKFIEILLTLKSLIFKITLIALIIKYFKKYTFLNRSLRFFNWILWTIFGISLIDNLRIDFLSNFINEIRLILSGIAAYLSTTQFYSFIASLFKTKEDVTNQTKISLRENPRIESKIGESTRNSKISEWLNPQPEVIEEDSDYRKYLILLALLIGAGLASYYYWDDLNPHVITLLDKIKYFWRRPGNDPDGNTGANINRIENMKSWVKAKFYKKDGTPDISHIDTSPGSPIANSSNIQLDNIVRDSSIDSIDQFFPEVKSKAKSVQFADPIEIQYTGLSDINSDNFDNSVAQVITEIDRFNKNQWEFPTLDLKRKMYNLTKARLEKLQQVDDFGYANIISTEYLATKINQFLAKQKESWFIADNYQDVEQIAIQEQDAWSDKSSSPDVRSPINESIHQVLSPIRTEEEVISPDMMSYAIEDQQVQDYKSAIETKVVESHDVEQLKFSNLLDKFKGKSVVKNIEESQPLAGPSSNPIDNLIDNEPNLNDSQLLQTVNESFNKDNPLIANRKYQQDVSESSRIPELTENDFENLLFRESWLKKLQTKWRKNLEKGNISVINELYTLKVTGNKRKLVYDENNKLIGTTPYIINEDKEIINK